MFALNDQKKDSYRLFLLFKNVWQMVFHVDPGLLKY